MFLKNTILALLLLSCTTFTYPADEAQCSTKGDYWHQGKCWKDYEDEGIKASEIDALVAQEKQAIEATKIEIADREHPAILMFPIEDKDGYLFIFEYMSDEGLKSLVFPTGKTTFEAGDVFESKVFLYNDDVFTKKDDAEKNRIAGTANIEVLDTDNFVLKISGKIDKQAFRLTTNDTLLDAGNSRIEVRGNEAYLLGNFLGTRTYWQVKDLLKNYPKVKTIVLGHINGSINDDVNMHTGRLLRENGFTTKVLSDSVVSSGGVDLFTAGVERIVEQGARLGVHSWCCVDEATAIEIPKDHPAHKYQIAYFTMTLGEELGEDFYFWTLEAAPFDGIHVMSDEEIQKWNLATDFVN